MPVSPIEDSESLSQSGETEEADENMDDRKLPIRDSRAAILENYGSLGEECRVRGKELKERKMMEEKSDGKVEVSNDEGGAAKFQAAERE